MIKTKTDITHAFRLLPGADLRVSIEKFIKRQHIEAGWIASCAGSLTAYSIRFARQKMASKREGYFEIVSLSGTLSVHGSHLHISIADQGGTVIGGHLLEGCIIYTTAEIIMVASGEFVFERKMDSTTGSKELRVRKNKRT